MIALTCNEIRRLFTVLIVEPARALGLPAGLVTLATPPPTPRPHQPLPAPTRRPSHGHNDLRLEY